MLEVHAHPPGAVPRQVRGRCRALPAPPRRLPRGGRGRGRRVGGGESLLAIFIYLCRNPTLLLAVSHRHILDANIGRARLADVACVARRLRLEHHAGITPDAAVGQMGGGWRLPDPVQTHARIYNEHDPAITPRRRPLYQTIRRPIRRTQTAANPRNGTKNELRGQACETAVANCASSFAICTGKAC